MLSPLLSLLSPFSARCRASFPPDALRGLLPVRVVASIVLSSGLPLFCGGSVVAQEEVRPLPGQTPIRPASPPERLPDLNTVEGALKRVLWDERQRGALIVVDPKQRFKQNDSYDPENPRKAPLPLKDSPNGVGVRDIGRRFSLRVVPLGSVTVLAPETMVVLNPNPGAGDPFASLRKDQKFRMLMATLTPTQWQMLGGNGLSANDLPKDSQELFLSILPNPMKVREMTQAESNGQRYYRSGAEVTISEAQRRGVRLRVARKVSYSFPTMTSENSTYGVLLPTSGDSPNMLQLVERWPGADERNNAFGVEVKAVVPNRLKPSQINWDAPTMGARVSLAGAKTVGDVVERIATATRATILADARLREVPVAIVGDSARAGDLLKALCWGTSGAVRRVTSANGARAAYVLTEDVQGMRTRVAKLADWAYGLTTRQGEVESKLRKKIVEAKPAQYFGFRQDDGDAPTPAMVERLDAERKKVGSFGGRTILDVRELPVALAATLREAGSRIMTGGSTQLNLDRVSVQTDYAVSYVVPGAGIIETRRFGGGLSLNEWDFRDQTDYYQSEQYLKSLQERDANALKPIAPNLVARGMIIAPTSVEDAKRWMARAKSVGLTHVIVQLSGENVVTDAAILKGTIREGKTLGIPVWAGVSFLARNTFSLADAKKPDVLPAGGDAVTKTPDAAAKSVATATVRTPGAATVNAADSPPAQSAEPKPSIEETEPVMITTQGNLPYRILKNVIPAELSDRTILGETISQVTRRRLRNLPPAIPGEISWQRLRLEMNLQDWFRPDGAGVKAAQARVFAVAKTPGLAGLLIRDVTAPGYDNDGKMRDFFNGNEGDFLDLGYTPDARLEFLLKEGVDPIDILPQYFNIGQISIDFPMFRDAQPRYDYVDGQSVRKDPPQKPARLSWHAFRHAKMLAAAGALYESLQAQSPNVPIFIHGTSTGGGNLGWIGSWDKPDGLPRWSYITENGQRPLSQEQQARKYSKTTFVLSYSFYVDDGLRTFKADEARRNLRSFLAMAKDWNGVLFDMSNPKTNERAIGVLADALKPDGIGAARAAAAPTGGGETAK